MGRETATARLAAVGSQGSASECPSDLPGLPPCRRFAVNAERRSNGQCRAIGTRFGDAGRLSLRNMQSRMAGLTASVVRRKPLVVRPANLQPDGSLLACNVRFWSESMAPSKVRARKSPKGDVNRFRSNVPLGHFCVKRRVSHSNNAMTKIGDFSQRIQSSQQLNHRESCLRLVIISYGAGS